MFGEFVIRREIPPREEYECACVCRKEGRDNDMVAKN